MRHLKNFYSVNESRTDGFFENTLTKSDIDVVEYDKDAYEDVDSISAKIVWADEIDYSGGGIDGINVIVHKVSVIVTYTVDDQREDVEFDIGKDDVEIKTSMTLPFYATSMEVNLISKKCVLSFGS